MERIERGFDSAYFRWFMDHSPLQGDRFSDRQRLVAGIREGGDLYSHSFWVETVQWGAATLRYLWEGLLPGSVPLRVPSLGMLFIGEEATAHGLTAEERGLPAVLDSLGALDRMCRARGMRLVVMMVPDKYTIYGPWASGRDVVADRGDILSPAFQGACRIDQTAALCAG